MDSEHAPFLHGVASADPKDDAVLIWTRVTTSPTPKVEWRVWEKIEGADPEALWETTDPIQKGFAQTSADSDFTVTVDVTGLQPATRYYYQFQDTQSSSSSQHSRRSVVGSTKTISKDQDEVKIAVLSCTSLWSGYFNFYRHMANRDDIELVLHLGDFIYPELDSDELYRVPYGLCAHADWFQPEESHYPGAPTAIMAKPASGLHGEPQDNQNNSYLVDMLENFPYCSPDAPLMNDTTSDVALERFRWMYNLYQMDPDLRAARQAHPFVVQFDNHDLGDDLPSLEVELDSGHPGAVQAGLEWVPQRVRHNNNIQRHDNTTTWKDDGYLSVDMLRRFQYGKDNLLDIIVLDTASYTGAKDQKIVHGMLGEGQRQWLDTVLTNSSQEGFRWRVLGSGKAFMPLTLNKLGRALFLAPAGLFMLFLVVLSAFLVSLEVVLVWKRGGKFFAERERTPSLEMDLLTRNTDGSSDMDFSEDQDDDDEPRKPVGMKEVLENVQIARQQSPGCLSRFSRWVQSWVFFFPLLAVLISIAVHHFVNPDGGLLNFDSHIVTWSGQHESVTRFFDQLESTGADSNNVWVTGDNHLCIASDVLRYNPFGKDLLSYNPHDKDVKRYGVEMLPCSGTRGNLNEMVGSFLPMCHPKYWTSHVSSFLSHAVVSIMNPHFRYFNGDDHGYGLVKVTKSKVETTFYHFPILEVTDQHKTKTMVVRHGENKWD